MVSTYVLYMYVYGHTILAAGEYCKGESMDGGGGGVLVIICMVCVSMS